MYYLNDKHPQYQYAIYCKNGSACPYIKAVLDNREEVKVYISSIVKWHKRYHHNFYIDNKFYKNEEKLLPTGFYYKVLRRTVNDWDDIE